MLVTMAKEINRAECIQTVMRCKCKAMTPKGVSYHPSLKAVYERRGAKGSFVKVGLRCPKCSKYYAIEGKTL